MTKDTRETKEEIEASQELGNAISQGEGGYTSYNTGTAKVNGKKQIVFSGKRDDLLSMSIDQLHESSKRSPFDRNRIFAAGKYQIICDTATGTLLAAKDYMKLPGSTKFSKETQESIFMHYLIGPTKRPPLYDYIHYGKGTLEGAVYAAAMEWASIAVPKGLKRQNGARSTGKESYYGSGNSASTSVATISQKIQAARNAYAQAQSGGGTKLPDKPTPIVDEQPVTKTETKPEKKPTKTTKNKTEKTDETDKTDKTPKKSPDDYRGYQLTGSVGLGGENKYDDVIAVQTRLAFFGIHTKADGKYGPSTLAAIKSFQKPFGIRDGLIEVGKKTQKELFSGQVTVDVKLDDPTRTKETENKTETKKTETKKTETKQPQTKTSNGMYMVGGYPSSQPAGNKPMYNGSPVSATIPGLPKNAGVKLTAQIVRAANAVAKYLPRGTVMTSGWRTDEEQAAIVIRYAGGMQQNDLYKTWLVAKSKKTVAWVGNSPHRPGLAMDLSGAPLGAINTAVLKAKADHPDAGIDDTITETRNNCLHVNVKP